MKIYFSVAQNTEKNTDLAEQVVRILNQAGILVLSNYKQEDIFEFAEQDLERVENSGESILKKIDAIIIDSNSSTEESGYLIALALTHKKPILYLAEKGNVLDRHLSGLLKNKDVAKILKVAFYYDQNLEKVILKFITEIETGYGIENPNIKFTLRITSRIERYLYWKTHNTKTSKADYLRDILEKMIAEDEEYKKYLKE
ncbi:MAG: hypothetical protein WCV92_00345 [Candidatus Buchananbacteria bacterium]|jgi:hypothetical protein